MVPVVQSTSCLAPIGVDAALEAAAETNIQPKLKIFNEFALTDRVGIVSGGNRSLGLEMALVLCEAGARVIYCLDLPEIPSEDWTKTAAFVKRCEKSGDVVDGGEKDWGQRAENGYMRAAAGIAKPGKDRLEYPAEQFENVLGVNVNGVLYTAQAAGQQMRRFGQGGSIILVSSFAGSVTLQGHTTISYCSSKSAILQVARSMACELGKENIRVNSLSPGWIHTPMRGNILNMAPHLLERWSSQNPMGRIGRPDELLGVTTWLASDASSFCTGSDILVSGGHTAW